VKHGGRLWYARAYAVAWSFRLSRALWWAGFWKSSWVIDELNGINASRRRLGLE
jgi:hypothetical protein